MIIDDEYPDTALAYAWIDTVFDREHLIELTGEVFTIGEGTYCTGVRVEAGEFGTYNVRRLRPLTDAARVFLSGALR